MVGPRVGGRDFWGRTEGEAKSARAHLLRRAYSLLVKHGWSPALSVSQAHRKERPEGTLSIHEAIGSTPGLDIDVHHAIATLNRIEFPAADWEAHPLRTQLEVLELFRKGIVMLGGEAPPLPEPVHAPRGGGWRLSHGSRRPPRPQQKAEPRLRWIG